MIVPQLRFGYPVLITHCRTLLNSLTTNAKRPADSHMESTASNTNAESTTLFATEFYRQPLPRSCVAFASDQGKRIFREALSAGHMEAYFSLAEQLCTQDEPAYCGLATLVMVLNAFEMDPGRIWKGPWRWYHESMLNCCVPPDVLTQGIILDKFVELAECNGLDVKLHRVQPSDNLSSFREVVKDMTSNEHKGYLVTCFSRQSLGQTGTGHFAAVGGYHPQRELVFLFDTARFKYPPHWVPIVRLWEAMGQLDPDTGQPRGYMILTRSSSFGHRDFLDQSDATKHLKLNLFGISDSTRQAYVSHATLCEPNSVSNRLRLVADAWFQWLCCEVNQYPDNPESWSSLITSAANFILSNCISHSLCTFFFTVQPFVDGMEQHTVRDTQYQMLRDLLISPFGQLVTAVVNSLPQDHFDWLTSTGSFRLAIGGSYSTFDRTYVRSSYNCPFAELSDPGLRSSLLLTSFMCSYPYEEVSKLCPLTVKCTRALELAKITKDAGFSDATVMELRVLRSVLWSLISTGMKQTDQPPLCCEGRKIL